MGWYLVFIDHKSCEKMQTIKNPESLMGTQGQTYSTMHPSTQLLTTFHFSKFAPIILCLFLLYKRPLFSFGASSIFTCFFVQNKICLGFWRRFHFLQDPFDLVLVVVKLVYQPGGWMDRWKMIDMQRRLRINLKSCKYIYNHNIMYKYQICQFWKHLQNNH